MTINSSKINSYNRVIELFFRLTLSALFFISLFSKLYSFTDFINFVSSILSLSESYSIKLSAILLAIEFFIAAKMLLGNSRFVYIVASILTIFFTIFLFLLALVSYKGNCFCFGAFLELPLWLSIIKNIIILIMLYCLLKHSVNDLRQYSNYFLLTATLLVCFYVLKEPQDYFRENPVSISVEQLVNSKNIIYIDARSKYAFQNFHIPAAINIPYVPNKIIPGSYVSQLDSIKADIPLVVYCDSRICSLAKGLTRKLNKIYPDRKIYHLTGGLEAWLERYQ